MKSCVGLRQLPWKIRQKNAIYTLSKSNPTETCNNKQKAMFGYFRTIAGNNNNNIYYNNNNHNQNHNHNHPNNNHPNNNHPNRNPHKKKEIKNI